MLKIIVCRSLFYVTFLVLIVACGGDSSTVNNQLDDSNTSQVTSPHPLSWNIATPEEVGMNSSLLKQAFDYAFEDGTFSQAALVIKDGNLVYEQYRGITDNEASILASTSSSNSDVNFYKNLLGQRDSNNLVSSWSTAKSFTSFLIGIAEESGYINSIHDPAADYINEWSMDERSSITIKDLLDMRSGLVPICFNFSEYELGECQNSNDASSGGNIIYANNQLTKCINRGFAAEGVTHPWYENGSVVFTRGSFQYSNCDTMVLGEIIFRATGQDIQTYGDYNLFSKINMEAFWWRDYEPSGQSNGNYLAYCCLDSTARDFAKFGKLFKDYGYWNGEKLLDSSFVKKVTTKRFNESPHYGYGFWLGDYKGMEYFSMRGHLGQYVIVFPKKNIIIVRLGKRNDKKTFKFYE